MEEILNHPEDLMGQTLDPQDWEAFRRLSHTALDDAIDYLRDVRERPPWKPVPEAIKQSLREPVPFEPQSVAVTYREFLEKIFPYPTGNIHPRFWGWVHGTGTATGILSEMMAAAMNSNCGGRDHAALYVERQVIDWCRQIVGYPEAASGILVSGTSMGSVIGLAVARNARAGCDVRRKGVACAAKALITYASSEAHSSVVKALELIGLGGESLHPIPVGNDFAIDRAALRRAIAQDRHAGRQPFCVVGCAGTVNTGGLDDLDALANICSEEGLWFHVDAAFGAPCALSDSLRPLIRGIERSDSVAFDFHKWVHVQYDGGCVLVRDGQLHRQAFAAHPDYLQHSERGLAGGGIWFTDLGPELSRSFRALKIWFVFKEQGAHRLGRMMEKNCRQAQYLARLVEATPALELLAPPTLNIVCFRYRDVEMGEKELDRFNREIVADLQERGIAAPSTTRIRGKVAIRVAITNHRSQREDFDLLVQSVLRLANERASRISHGLNLQ